MKNENSVLSATIAGILAAWTALVTTAAWAVPDQSKNWEKYAGIAKTGMNDCGALDGSHQCADQAKFDNADHKWVYVPQGTCTKITAGQVAAAKPAK